MCTKYLPRNSVVLIFDHITITIPFYSKQIFIPKFVCREMEARQQAELAMRNIKIEMRTQQNQMKEVIYTIST